MSMLFAVASTHLLPAQRRARLAFDAQAIGGNCGWLF
jgi:hypothetical protein